MLQATAQSFRLPSLPVWRVQPAAVRLSTGDAQGAEKHPGDRIGSRKVEDEFAFDE